MAIIDDAGQVLVNKRIGENAAGVTALVMMLADHADTVDGFVPVDVALETGRGLLVTTLRAAGHRLYEINPKASSRYRDRHAASGTKSDAGDALVLAHLLRTDRDRHRPMSIDSEQVAVLGVLARAGLSQFPCKSRMTDALRYHRGSRPGKTTINVFRAIFQPCVPVPDSPPRLLEMFRSPR